MSLLAMYGDFLAFMFWVAAMGAGAASFGFGIVYGLDSDRKPLERCRAVGVAAVAFFIFTFISITCMWLMGIR